MKVIIVSDSHTKNDFKDYVNKEMYDFAIHAGDAQTFDESELSNYFDKYVKGNTDFMNLPKNEIFKLGELVIGLTHGHLYDVNYSNDTLISNFSDCDIIIHGHTHVVRHEIIENILVLNPGSTAQSRSKYPKTFMELEISNRNVVVKVIDYIDKSIIEEEEFNL